MFTDKRRSHQKRSSWSLWEKICRRSCTKAFWTKILSTPKFACYTWLRFLLFENVYFRMVKNAYTSEWLKMQLAVWTEKIKSRHARGDQHVSCVGGTLALGLDQVCTTFSYCRPHYFYSYEVRPPMSSSYIYEIVPTNTEHIQTNCVINL